MAAGRPKNSRRTAVGHLRLLIQLMRSEVSSFELHSGKTLWEFKLNEAGEPRQPGENCLVRPREWHEYAENDPAHWEALAGTLAAVVDGAEHLRRYAVQQAARAARDAAERKLSDEVKRQRAAGVVYPNSEQGRLDQHTEAEQMLRRKTDTVSVTPSALPGGPPVRTYAGSHLASCLMVLTPLVNGSATRCTCGKGAR